MAKRSYTLWTAIGIGLVASFCIISFARGGDLWVISLLMLPPLVAAATTTPGRTIGISALSVGAVALMGTQGAPHFMDAAHATRVAVVALASVLAVQTSILRERNHRTRRRLAFVNKAQKSIEAERPGTTALDRLGEAATASGFAQAARVVPLARSADGEARPPRLLDRAPREMLESAGFSTSSTPAPQEAIAIDKSVAPDQPVRLALFKPAGYPTWDEVDLAQTNALAEHAAERERSGQLLRAVLAAQEELRESRDEIAAIISGVASGIVAQRPGGEVVYANVPAAAMLGVGSPNALVGRNFREVIDSLMPRRQDGNAFDVSELPGMRALAGENLPAALIHWDAAPDHEERWALIRATAVTSDTHEPLLAIAVLEDNTERMQMLTTLQRSLMPPALPTLDGVTLSASFSPAERDAQVAGDFYDAFVLSDGTSAMVIGDVCGKGPEAASLTSLVRYTLRAAAMHETSPERILSTLNEAMLDQVDDDRFCTLCMLRLMPEADGSVRMESVSAGHPVPVATGAAGASALGEPGTLLGVVATPKLPLARGILAPGEFITLYTDGLSAGETTDDAAYATDLLNQIKLEPSAPIAPQIDAAAAARQDQPGRDDVAIIVAQAVRDVDELS